MENLSYKDAKILVVDDVEEVLRSTKNSLVFEGMDVECMNNPLEALEYLKTHHVDVLLLDFFMPDINGDVFVKKLREFNNETIVILRTGYSDQVPPLKVIDSLNVQGYIDKLKGEDELILMTKAAIKTAYLTRSIKEKDSQIELLNYKSTAVGNLVTQLVNEAESQIFSISGAVNMLEGEEADSDLVRIISRANENIEKLFRALRFGSSENIRVNEFISIIRELLKARSKMDCMELKLSTDINDALVAGKIDVLVLGILEIYYYLHSVNATELNLNIANESGKVTFTIVHNPNYTDEFLTKLKNLLKSDSRLILTTDNFLKITLYA